MVDNDFSKIKIKKMKITTTHDDINLCIGRYL